MNLFCKNPLCIHRNIDRIILCCNQTVDSLIITKYSWAKEYSCGSCNSKFYLCSICNNEHQSRKLLIKSQLYRHAKLHQRTEQTSKRKSKPIFNVKEKKNKICTLQNVVTKKPSYTVINVDDSRNESSVPLSNQSVLSKKSTASDISSNKSSITSASSLVALANCGTESMDCYISNEDTMLHMLLARFTSKLSRYQRHDLCEIFKLLQNKYSITSNEKRDVDDKEIELDIPTTDASIRKQYLTGKDSIIKNIPTPAVIEFKNHSYTSIKECVSNYLLLNKTAKTITSVKNRYRSVSNITECVAAQHWVR